MFLPIRSSTSFSEMYTSRWPTLYTFRDQVPWVWVLPCYWPLLWHKSHETIPSNWKRCCLTATVFHWQFLLLYMRCNWIMLSTISALACNTSFNRWFPQHELPMTYIFPAYNLLFRRIWLLHNIPMLACPVLLIDVIVSSSAVTWLHKKVYITILIF